MARLDRRFYCQSPLIKELYLERPDVLESECRAQLNQRKNYCQEEVRGHSQRRTTHMSSLCRNHAQRSDPTLHGTVTPPVSGPRRVVRHALRSVRAHWPRASPASSSAPLGETKTVSSGRWKFLTRASLPSRCTEQSEATGTSRSRSGWPRTPSTAFTTIQPGCYKETRSPVASITRLARWATFPRASPRRTATRWRAQATTFLARCAASILPVHERTQKPVEPRTLPAPTERLGLLPDVPAAPAHGQLLSLRQGGHL